MSRGSLGARRIQRLFETGSLSGLSDWHLLDRFARLGDQVAFELLVSRHGPMVLGVCRRILRDPSEADDAFQATFLVLIRRARSLGPGDVLAAWLHGVALKVATRARSDRARRARREREALKLEAPARDRPDPDFALREVIDKEVERLPWKYRVPIVLCYFEGLTHEEAARRLDWPLGTVKGRLARARALLGERLSRRGITTTAGALVGSLGIEGAGRAAVSEPLLAATLRAAARIVEGAAWTTVVSANVANLARGVFTAMLVSKFKIVGAMLLVSGTALAGAGIAARPGPGAEETDPRPVEARPSADEVGTPAPETAEASPTARSPRSPSVDQLGANLIEAARSAFLKASEGYRDGRASLDRAIRTSRLLLEAQTAASESDEERIAAASGHLDRLRSLMLRGVPNRPSADAESETAEARALLAEAEAGLSRARAAKEPAGNNFSSAKKEQATDPASVAILKKLDEPVAMSFPNETPLEDVLDYIKQATEGPDGSGIPIYVDPIGLNEAERTETSPVSIDLDGVPLRRTLQLALKQIGLKYFVDDGILVITSADSSDTSFEPSTPEPSPLLELQERARRGELDVDEMKELVEKLKLIKELDALEEVPPGEFLNIGEKAGGSASMTSEQAGALLQQMKELAETLKSARGRT